MQTAGRFNLPHEIHVHMVVSMAIGGTPKWLDAFCERENPNLKWMIFLGVARDDETETTIYASTIT